MYTPLITTLLTLAETRGFSDKGILNNIMTILKRLESNLLNFRKQQETEGKKNVENQKEQAHSKIEEIKLIAKIKGQNESNKIDSENVIKSSNTDVGFLDAQKSRKENELNYWNKICSFQASLKTKGSEWKKDFDTKLQDVTKNLMELK